MFRHFWFSQRERFLKNFLNFSFWAFLLAGFYFLFFVSDNPKNYPRFQGYIAFLSAFILVVPVFLYHGTRLQERYRDEFVTTWKGLLGLPLILNALGAQGLFDIGIGYDSFLHFFSSWLFGLFLAFSFFLASDAYGRRPNIWITFFFISTVTLFGGFLMEVYERYADLWLGTQQWGEAGQDPWEDTYWDLVYDMFGALLAGITILRYHWQWFERLKKIQESQPFIRIQGAVKKAARTTKKNFSSLQKTLRDSSSVVKRMRT